MDALNATFELCAACMLLLDVRQIRKDKQAAGVTGWAASFFVAWAAFCIPYYYELGQWWSLSAALAVLTVRTVWLFYYTLYAARTNHRKNQAG